MPGLLIYLKKYRNSLLLLFCLVIIRNGPGWTQNSITSPLTQRSGNFIFDNIEWDKGTSNPFIPSIFQDRQGFIWFSTKNGLVRYDGYQLKRYTHHPADTNSLSSNFVWHITQDHEGYLWVPTRIGGLNRFDPVRETFSHFPLTTAEGYPVNYTWTVLEDSQNRLWVGTKGEGLFVINADRDSVTHFLHDPEDPGSLAGNIVGRCFEDSQKRIWVSNEIEGLCLFNDETGTFRRFEYLGGSKKGLASKAEIYDMAEDSSGRLWVPSFNGLSVLEMKDTSFDHFYHNSIATNSLSDNMIWHLTIDSKNRVWMPTSDGLNLAIPGKKPQFFHFFSDPLNPHSILNDYAYKAFEDREGIIWIATGDGISKLNPPNFQFISLVTTLQEKKEVNFEGGFRGGLFENHQGNICGVTHHGGVYVYDPDWNTYSYARLDTNSVYDEAEEDQSGRLWVTKGRLYLRDPVRTDFRSVCQLAPSLCRETPPITNFTLDSVGNIWAGSGRQIFKIDSKTLELKGSYTIHRRTDQSMLFAIRGIKVDHFGNLWFGGEGHGLYHFDTQTETFSHVEIPNAANLNFDPTAQNIYSIDLDSKGYLWIHRNDRLLQLKPDRAGKVEYLNAWETNAGTFHEDKLGRYWLVTNKDITAFDPEQGMQRTFSLKGITERLDGSLASTANGDLYLGGFQGLYRFNPDHFQVNTQAPSVVLTDFKLSGRSLPVRGTYGDTLSRPSPLDTSIRFDRQIDLRYDQNDFSIQFAALSFIQPKLNQYKFLLEGYPRDTIYTTAEFPMAIFTNLSPGHYTFRVWASNSDGYWNKTGASLKIRIFPPWYWAWWSKTVYFLLFISILLVLNRFQIKRKLAQAEADRLRELDTAKSRLYTNITHEFRTPLTIILGIVEQLKGQVAEHTKASLQLVSRNGRQLLQLINEMLDLAKLESGQFRLQYEQGDVIGYLRYLVESFHSHADSKQIRLHFMSDLREYHMDYDAKQLMHVVVNLLSNAIKFSPEGKDVYVFVKCITKDRGASRISQIASSNISEQLLITVKDSGIGIPKDKLLHIFDRFYQLDDSPTRSGEGTGIGLTLTRELVELMGGRIEVKSDLGVGSTFTVILPVRREHPPVSSPVPGVLPLLEVFAPPVELTGAARREHKPLMLIVEDNADLVKYLINIFNPTYNLEVAYNGEQGAEKAGTLIPDIIITDVMMPEKDGFELCSNLKNNRLTSHIPIIMLTARADADSRLDGLQRGADAYLEKPFLPEELKTQIKALLKQRERLQAYYLSEAGLSNATQKERPKEVEVAAENSFLASINQLMEENIQDESFNVEQLARSLFIDPSNLYRKITALTGISPSEYIRTFRIAKAKKLLLETDFSIAVVAGECGFTSQNYFSKLFKRETGLSPTAFRKKQQA